MSKKTANASKPKIQKPVDVNPEKMDLNVENLTALASDIISLNEQIGRNVILMANVHNQILSTPKSGKDARGRVINVKVLKERKNVAREGVLALMKTIKEEIATLEYVTQEI